MAEQVSTTADEPQNAQTNQEQPVLLTEGTFMEDRDRPASQKEEEVVVDGSEEDTNNLFNQIIGEKTIQEAVEETLSEKLDKVSINGDEDKEPVYVTPVPDPYARAIRYMERHNVMQIFQVSELVNKIK